MEKYKYGPLVYNTVDPNDDDSGNFYWGGLVPVGYDEFGIPIDERGFQCLDLSSPLHPQFIPPQTDYNEVLEAVLPKQEIVKEWFTDNFLEISDWQVCYYILRWYNAQEVKSTTYYKIVSECKSIEEVIQLAWPDVQKS
jgi:hypothetical protein